MEEEKPHRVPSRSNGPTATKGGRFGASNATVDDGGGDMARCSGKFCRSCTAGLIADCVALCCCPCAVVHCFALAFVKAPWFMGKRCLGLKSKKKKKVKSKRKCKMGSSDVEEFDSDDGDYGGVSERDMDGKLKVESSSNKVGELESVTINDGFEAEKVWLELYQIGHLDFGRVSYSHD